MSKLFALLTIAAIATSGCDDHPTSTPSMEQADSSAAVAPSATPGHDWSAQLQAQRLTGLQRMKATLDGLDWRCDEEESHKTRTAAIRLRSTLAVFQRVCRDALDEDQAPQQRALVVELAGAVRAKIAGCQRLGNDALPKRSTDLCDVTAEGAVR